MNALLNYIETRRIINMENLFASNLLNISIIFWIELFKLGFEQKFSERDTFNPQVNEYLFKTTI